jgi:hypothetical protein
MKQVTRSQYDLQVGYLGWVPKVQCAGLNEIEAQIQYLRKRATLRVNVDGRVKEY